MHPATVRLQLPSVPRPLTAVPILGGPSGVAPGSPELPAHLGAAGLRLMMRCVPAPALRLPQSKQSLASDALSGLPPHRTTFEDILMGCFLHWTATGADPLGNLPALQRVAWGLGASRPALHEACNCRYGTANLLWCPPRLH